MTNTFASGDDQNALAAIFFKRWSSFIAMDRHDDRTFEQLATEGVVSPQYTAFAAKVIAAHEAQTKPDWWQNPSKQPEPYTGRGNTVQERQARERYDRELKAWQQIPFWVFIIEGIAEAEELFSPYVLAVFSTAAGRTKEALQTLFSTYGFEQNLTVTW